MKFFKALVATTILFVSHNSKAQSSRVYGSWQPLYSETSNNQELKVEISFSLVECSENRASRWRIQNQLKKSATLFFKFDWIDCQNKVHTESNSFDLKKTGINEDMGYWFYGKTVVKIYDVHLGLIEKEPKITSVDGTLIKNEPDDKQKKNVDLDKLYGKTKIKVDTTKKFKSKGLNPTDIRRGDNSTPKVESVGITVE